MDPEALFRHEILLQHEYWHLPGAIAGLRRRGLCAMPAELAMPEEMDDTRSSAPLRGRPTAPSSPLPTPMANPLPLPVL